MDLCSFVSFSNDLLIDFLIIRLGWGFCPELVAYLWNRRVRISIWSAPVTPGSLRSTLLKTVNPPGRTSSSLLSRLAYPNPVWRKMLVVPHVLLLIPLMWKLAMLMKPTFSMLRVPMKRSLGPSMHRLRIHPVPLQLLIVLSHASLSPSTVVILFLLSEGLHPVGWPFVRCLLKLHLVLLFVSPANLLICGSTSRGRMPSIPVRWGSCQ